MTDYFNNGYFLFPIEQKEVTVIETELAWAAGFFDGEGCASLRTNPNGRCYPRLCLWQYERSTIDRFAAAVGEGKIYGPYRNGRAWEWQTGKADTCERVMQLLWPYLSRPKRDQWERVQSEVWAWSKGHPLVAPHGRPAGFRHSSETRLKISEARRAGIARRKLEINA